jgi:hypothetical protein
MDGTHMDARQQREFVKLVNVALVAHGARPNKFRPDQIDILTRAGTLEIVRIDASRGYASVMARFKDPAFAALHTDCNPYSGKWNAHYSVKGKMDGAEVCRWFVERLQTILPARVDSRE